MSETANPSFVLLTDGNPGNAYIYQSNRKDNIDDTNNNNDTYPQILC